ncbi:MAG: aspartate aminotransferase family protein [Alphaproteobacteria bacterium]|nr:aspartate aminotransferase family protein [Alphaproteobacteria bacterium]
MSALFPVYPRLPITLVRAEGTRLHTADGRVITDLYGAHAVCPLGHGHPAVVEALSTAVRTLDFYSNSLVMPVQEEAAQAVLGGSAHLAYVHFVNSGTEANEAALHLARKRTGRATVVTTAGSFHGRTLGSLSVTGLPGYRGKIPVQVPADWHRSLPLGADDLSVIDETVACVLIESVESLGGIRVPPPGWLARVEARCREVGAVFALDEVQGGVGRLGTWFAHETLGCTPDLVTLAKSLGNGFPVAALVTTAAMAEGVAAGELGTTFGGGPMACAVVSAVARTIRDEGLMARVLDIEARVRAGLAGLPGVEVRGRGALLGVQTPLSAKALQAALLERDLLVGTSGQAETIRLLLPYVVSDDELDRCCAAIAEVLS